MILLNYSDLLLETTTFVLFNIFELQLLDLIVVFEKVGCDVPLSRLKDLLGLSGKALKVVSFLFGSMIPECFVFLLSVNHGSSIPSHLVFIIYACPVKIILK